VDENEVKETISKFRKSGVEAIAVCLFNSYANSENEKKVEKIINGLWPEVYVSVSHKIAKEIREYERTSTTVLDAYIKPPSIRYFDLLENQLHVGDKMLISNAAGGVSKVSAVKENCISTFSSGPAGGVMGALHIGRILGIKNLLTGDVGGTSYDVCRIVNGEVTFKTEATLEGYPVLLQRIDVRSIGAGGGSIAYVDDLGLLHVGPESAQSYPGPMCYGRGGTKPTATDAAVVNGLINPAYFLGGEMKLNAGLAAKGVEELGKKLGLSTSEVSEGILKVLSGGMANLIREILIEEGNDPRDFVMLSYGGAGGLFAGRVAKDMSIRRVIIPRLPSVFCTHGLLVADVAYSFSETHISLLDELPIQELDDIYSAMEDKAVKLLKETRVPESAIALNRYADMKYEGQGHHVQVPLPGGRLSEKVKEELKKTFKGLHERKYGHVMEAAEMIVNLRLNGIGKTSLKELLKKIPKGGKNPPRDSLKKSRKIYLDGDSFDCDIYERDALVCGNVINGPAIVEEAAHTTLVFSNEILTVDEYGNLVIDIGGAE
jgi:N-methylhydantoinase A